MKKKSFTIMLLLGILLGISVSVNISCKAKAGAGPDSSTEDVLAIPALMERQGELAKASEWAKTKEKIAALNQKIAQQSGDVKSRLQIATIYISEARITAQHGYYDPAILKILDGVLALDAKNFEAYVYKALVKMSQHQFAEALALAEKARAVDPESAYVYGMLTDAQVELGNYKQAIEMSDKMQALKPSLESYSRASYLREIHGDYPGAVTAMKLAVGAGIPGSESAEWARVTLGDLFLNSGKPDSAEVQYKTALALRPNFTNAEIGLAKVEKARKNYNAAISHTEAAIRIISESPYVALLGQLYELKGDKDKANEIFNDVIDLLEKAEKEQANNESKHNGNRELAMAYLDGGKLDKAMEFAKKDLAGRPENIDANELAAWIAYKKKDYAAAKEYADKMLATNTMNANTLYKAALIYKAAGDKGKSDQLMAKAKSANNYIDERILSAAN
jgi:tetratricopeptide (TPR) repeat protein